MVSALDKMAIAVKTNCITVDVENEPAATEKLIKARFRFGSEVCSKVATSVEHKKYLMVSDVYLIQN